MRIGEVGVARGLNRMGGGFAVTINRMADGFAVTINRMVGGFAVTINRMGGGFAVAINRMVGGLAMMVCLAAADGALAQGSAEDQEACKPDVFRLCSSQIPNVDAIVACLRTNEPNLNAACHRVMFPAPAVSEKPVVVKKLKRRVRIRHHE